MKYQYWFANIQGISCKKKLFLLSHVKSAEELYYIEEMTLKKWGVEEKDCHKILQSVKEWSDRQQSICWLIFSMVKSCREKHLSTPLRYFVKVAVVTCKSMT